MTASWRRRAARLLAVGGLTCLVGGQIAATAFAETAQRVGWWNTVSAAGAAAPAPTSPSDGIHVEAANGTTLAFGALMYAVAADGAARLVLAIGGSAGTVALAACPTKGTSWPDGGDQPSDKAPAYDCSAIHYPGVASADGTTVTFTLPTTAGVTQNGLLSLAIVPDTSALSAPTTGPTFSADIARPGADAFTVAAVPAAPGPSNRSGAFYQPWTSSTSGRPLGLPGAGAPSAAELGPTGDALPSVAPPAPSTPTTEGVHPSAHVVPRAVSTTASVMGAVAIIAALVLWGLGSGLLGGRIRPLSVPLADNASD
jgi:hypothetical protein